VPPRHRKPLAHLTVVVLRALVDERRCAPEGLEGVAQAVVDVAGLGDFPEPELLAAALGYEVARHHFASCGQGTLLGRALVVRPSACVRTFGLRVLHELAHALLLGSGDAHGHGDVWLLTLMLLVPRRVLRRRAVDLRGEAWGPGWAVDLRVAAAQMAEKAG
jgi:hypothetical protein